MIQIHWFREQHPIVGSVIDNGALTFNRSDASALAGAISGAGGNKVFSSDSIAARRSSALMGLSLVGPACRAGLLRFEFIHGL